MITKAPRHTEHNVQRFYARASRENEDEILVIRRIDRVDDDVIGLFGRRINPDLRGLWCAF